jgi:translocator protein
LHDRWLPRGGEEGVFQTTDPHGEGAGPRAVPPANPGLALVGFVGLGLLVGAAGGALTAAAVRGWYAALVHPPGTPPDAVFGPVWGVLYVLMGVAAWRIWRRVQAGPALRLWGWQLAANAAWTPVFFGLHQPLLALAVMLALIVLIVLTARRFAAIDRPAAMLLVPYLLWTGYAFYLNAGICWLNRG